MNFRAATPWALAFVGGLLTIWVVVIVFTGLDCIVSLYFGKFLYPLNQIVGVCINRAAFSFLLFR